MRKKILFILLSSLLVLLGACSASEMDTESSEDKAMAPESEASNEVGTESEELANETSSDESQKAAPVVSVQRMIIHKAILSVNVKELDKNRKNFLKDVEQYGGYIVESNVYHERDVPIYRAMIVRIPEENFEKFLLEAEGEAAKVLERNVTGQDVTEQYVDLESRVRSKRVVEERLLDFMSKAQKTEDLLKISEDLAQVQEEIEVMVGKMKYLENQTSFSTIEISMYENRVVVPEIDSKELNTWEKTKKQFATSTNSLLSAASAFIVFFIGNLPVLLLLSVIAFVVYWFIKRRLQKKV